MLNPTTTEKMMTASLTIKHARNLGIDIDTDQCDLATLADDLPQLAAMDPTIRARVVAEMNDGWTMAQALTNLRGW